MARPCPTLVRIASVVSSMNAVPLHFGLGFANAEEEIAEEFGAAFRVIHLDVKLHGVNFTVRIFERRDGVVGVAGGVKTGWNFADVVAVAVPDAEGVGHAGEEF